MKNPKQSLTFKVFGKSGSELTDAERKLRALAIGLAAYREHSQHATVSDFKQFQQQQRAQKKLEVIEGAGMDPECSECGYDECIAALDFHHADPTKKDPLMKFGVISVEDAIKEARKCVLLCANCHREEHYKNGNRRGQGRKTSKLDPKVELWIALSQQKRQKRKEIDFGPIFKTLEKERLLVENNPTDQRALKSIEHLERFLQQHHIQYN